MFYNERTKLFVRSCSFNFDNTLGKDYLKIKGLIHTDNYNSKIYTSNFSQTFVNVKLFGEKEELEKLQNRLTEALKKEKKQVITYVDLRLKISLWKQGARTTQFYNFFVEDYIDCPSIPKYRATLKTREKFTINRVKELEKENETLMRKLLEFEKEYPSKLKKKKEKEIIIIEEEERDFLDELNEEATQEETIESDYVEQEEKEMEVEKVEKPKESKTINDFFNEMFGGGSEW